MHPTQLIYQSAGTPGLDTCGALPAFSCWLCATQSVRGIEVKTQIKPTFTDIDFAQAPASEYVCEACAWTMMERSEKLAQLVSKDKPQRMRNYTHIVKGGIWHPCSKADKSRMQELIFVGALPELIVLALSGQKHLIFKARTNRAGGHVGYILVEESLVFIDQYLTRDDLLLVELLYSQFSKSEIETGSYQQHRIRKFGLSSWQQCEATIRKIRGTPQLDLVLFLAQKRDHARKRFKAQCRYATHVNLGRDTEGIQSAVSAQHLGTVRGRGEDRSVHEQSGKVQQLTLL